MTLNKALFKVHKMDRRFSAYPYFTHYIEAKAYTDPDNFTTNFFTLREWFWAQFGPSKEFRYWKEHKAPNVIPGKRSDNDLWCWDTEFGNQRLYVTGQALTAFNLKWI